MLAFILSELSIVAYGIASTARSPNLARFGIAFHGLFSSLVLLIRISPIAASTSLLISSVLIPLVLTRTPNQSTIGMHPLHACAVVLASTLIPIVLLRETPNIWIVQSAIQFLLAGWALRKLGGSREVVIGVAGLGHASAAFSALLLTSLDWAPPIIEIGTLIVSISALRVSSRRGRSESRKAESSADSSVLKAPQSTSFHNLSDDADTLMRRSIVSATPCEIMKQSKGCLPSRRILSAVSGSKTGI